MKLILLMILGHLVSDYTLQGWLADAKQKAWWRKQTTYPMYKNDWLAGLACHSLYWSILTFLPLYNSDMWAVIVLGNAVLHAWIDHGKANLRVINLWQDQTLHLLQIVLSAALGRIMG